MVLFACLRPYCALTSCRALSKRTRRDANATYFYILFLKIAEAVKALHDCSIAHMDLADVNICVSEFLSGMAPCVYALHSPYFLGMCSGEEMQVCLIDFGAARLFGVGKGEKLDPKVWKDYTPFFAEGDPLAPVELQRTHDDPVGHIRTLPVGHEVNKYVVRLLREV